MNAEKSSPEPDALERRLAGTPARPAPAELRGAVLRAAADVGQSARRPAGGARPPAVSAPPAWWEQLLARFPLATGGFAACWLIAWLGGSADRWLNGPVAAAPVRVSAEQVAEARAQRAELRQLAGLEDAPTVANLRHRLATPSPAVPPGPRGDRRRARDDGFGHVPAPDSFLVV
jgi:hypothetical protein